MVLKRGFIPRGTFIYRLAGRDRENSASYYTPEILTQCLVKYSLKELLKDKKADDILDLTICEPAMGSAAFLVEAVNQLADAYLERKQMEIGKRITPDKYNLERQKVRAFITDRNTFGVDLNPIAVELGQVSLWLNCIHEGDFVPWFGDQLFPGNSLIGARAEVYPENRLEQSTKKEGRWYNHGSRAVTKGKPRKDNEIYHFLLPDPGMSDYNDRIVKPYMSEESERIKWWLREFSKPLNTDEIHQLKDLSNAVDKLFEENVKNLAEERRENNDPIEIFGRPASTTQGTDYTEKNQKLAKIRGDEEKNSPAYLRLKTAMNYWCALWFWPLKDSKMLPSRSEFIMDMSLILEGNVFSTTFDFSDQEKVNDEQKEIYAGLLNEIESVGKIDINELNQKIPRLRVVSEITDTNRFFHWPVEFGDILNTKGGFDLILGNPPWIVPEWSDRNILSAFCPKITIRKHTAGEVENLKQEIIRSKNKEKEYLNTYVTLTSVRNFLSSSQNFELIDGKVNLYKCFILVALGLNNKYGISALLHPEGHLLDPKGGRFRKFVFENLIYHFQFQNELNKLLFQDVHPETRFSINVYNNSDSLINFTNISNLYYPSTIDECFYVSSIDLVPAMKDESGKPLLSGHPDRMIHINQDTLEVFARIMEFGKLSKIEATRMPSPHSSQVLGIYKKFGTEHKNMEEANILFQMDHIWNETTDVKRTKIIKRENAFQKETDKMIINGPNFYVANPLAKTPREICRNNGDYDSIDLTFIPDDYLQRSNYTPNLSQGEYYSLLPKVSWSNHRKNTDYFGCFIRAMTSPTLYRTLVCAMEPPGIAHPNGVLSVRFKEEIDLLNAVSLWASLPYDFVIKSSGNDDVRESSLKTLPWVKLPSTALHRMLQLSCLTTWFAPIWDRQASKLEVHGWSDNRLSLTSEGPKSSTDNWTRKCGLRTDFARRQALLEIDVLVAIALGLNFDDFIQMYRVQFPVMQSFDRETWFDQNGRIVFTKSMNFGGFSLSRQEWKNIENKPNGSVFKEIEDKTLPTGPVKRKIEYFAPFVNSSREEDYQRAWDYFFPKYGKDKVSV